MFHPLNEPTDTFPVKVAVDAVILPVILALLACTYPDWVTLNGAESLLPKYFPAQNLIALLPVPPPVIPALAETSPSPTVNVPPPYIFNAALLLGTPSFTALLPNDIIGQPLFISDSCLPSRKNLPLLAAIQLL